MMKFIYLNIILIAVLITVFSCQSPVDVEANRQKQIIKLAPDSTDPGINADFNELDYGIVFKNSKEQLKQVKIMNTTDKRLFISGCNVNQNAYFNIDTSIFPITLEPKGHPGSDFILRITFYPNKTGQFQDTLKFKNIPNVYIKLKATVPSVFVEDVEFEHTKIGSTSEGSVVIYNFGTNYLKITDYIIKSDKDSVFKFNDSIERVINPRSYLTLKMSFSPKDSKEYISEIIFDIVTDNEGPIINYGILKGFGIRE